MNLLTLNVTSGVLSWKHTPVNIRDCGTTSFRLQIKCDDNSGSTDCKQTVDISIEVSITIVHCNTNHITMYICVIIKTKN